MCYNYMVVDIEDTTMLLLPTAVALWPLVKHDGRAEAALIALWGSRQLGGIARPHVGPLSAGDAA